MRTINLPISPTEYSRLENQVFRDHIRRNIQDAHNLAQAVSEKLRFGIMPVYADDAAAAVGGLIQGSLYRTATGVLMIKL